MFTQDTRFHTTHVAQNTYSTSVPGRWPVIVPSCLAPVPLCVPSPLGHLRPDVDRPLRSHPCENICPCLVLSLDGVLRLLPLCSPHPCPRHGGLAPLLHLTIPLHVRPVPALVCRRKPGSDLVLSFPRPVLPRRPDHTPALLARFMLRCPPAPVAMAAFPNCLWTWPQAWPPTQAGRCLLPS